MSRRILGDILRCNWTQLGTAGYTYLGESVDGHATNQYRKGIRSGPTATFAGYLPVPVTGRLPCLRQSRVLVSQSTSEPLNLDF